MADLATHTLYTDNQNNNSVSVINISAYRAAAPRAVASGYGRWRCQRGQAPEHRP